MKKIGLLLIIFIFLTSSCLQRDKELADWYKHDLQYYENSIKFSMLNMTDEAYDSCNRASTLRNECFISLAQHYAAENLQTSSKICDEIKPEQKMRMTKKAFTLVYPTIDESLEMEIKEKLNPSKQSIATLKRIKEDCYQRT